MVRARTDRAGRPGVRAADQQIRTSDLRPHPFQVVVAPGTDPGRVHPAHHQPAHVHQHPHRVPGRAGPIKGQRHGRPGQRVEQRRFADVRRAHRHHHRRVDQSPQHLRIGQRVVGPPFRPAARLIEQQIDRHRAGRPGQRLQHPRCHRVRRLRKHASPVNPRKPEPFQGAGDPPHDRVAPVRHDQHRPRIWPHNQRVVQPEDRTHRRRTHPHGAHARCLKESVRPARVRHHAHHRHRPRCRGRVDGEPSVHSSSSRSCSTSSSQARRMPCN